MSLKKGKRKIRWIRHDSDHLLASCFAGQLSIYVRVRFIVTEPMIPIISEMFLSWDLMFYYADFLLPWDDFPHNSISRVS